MFRGNPHRTGFVHTTDVPEDAVFERFFEAQSKIITTPLLVEDMVCFGCCTQRTLILDRKKPHTFHAVDWSTGKERWSFQAEKGIVSSPACSDDAVLVCSLDGKLYAYDLDGRRKWAFEAAAGILSSPAVHEGCAIFGAGDMSGGWLYCLDLKTQRLRWPPVKMPAGPYASPCVAHGNIFLGTYWSKAKDSYFYILDAATGKMRKVTKQHKVCWCATAASDGKTVYAADCGEWKQPSLFFALDAATGDELWRLQLVADNIASSIALIGDLAVFGCDRGKLHAVNVRTRQIEWTNTHNAKSYHSSPCATPDRIYIGSQRRRLHVFDHAGNHLAEHKARAEIESSPVIRDGRLFVGCNDGWLYRLA
jgi:serine/threonine-protein kinase